MNKKKVQLYMVAAAIGAGIGLVGSDLTSHHTPDRPSWYHCGLHCEGDRPLGPSAGEPVHGDRPFLPAYLDMLQGKEAWPKTCEAKNLADLFNCNLAPQDQPDSPAPVVKPGDYQEPPTPDPVKQNIERELGHLAGHEGS